MNNLEFIEIIEEMLKEKKTEKETAISENSFQKAACHAQEERALEWVLDDVIQYRGAL
jgi:hypothetical protein